MNLKIKSKIANRLIIYFSITLITFSIIIGITFMILFNKHVVNIHKSDMEKKITTISQRLSDYISGNKHMMPGLGAYIKLLDDIAMTDVWLVDNNMNIITSKSSNNETPTLPSSGDYAIKEAFKGKISFSENFSDILNTKTLTASAPIYSNGNIVACVLLHSPVEGITSITKNGISILIISIVLSLFISIFISIALAVYFTKPLNKMKHTANLLSTGNYTAKTNIKQNDEIGDLAKSIDILSEKLKEAAYESEKLDKMRKDFISNISHELRTPVTVIRGSLEALSDGIIKDPEKIKEYYNQMLSESIQLQRLINDLLDLSRLQNLDFKIETTPLNILDVVNDSIRSMRQISNKKNIKLSFKSSINQYILKGDYGRLCQMINIVLDNAIKFSPENETIEISLFKNDNMVLCIKDKGCGIPSEEIPYVFDRFHKSNSSENLQGSGLGLSIAKQIADRHNIKINIESKVMEYTKFMFFL